MTSSSGDLGIVGFASLVAACMLSVATPSSAQSPTEASRASDIKSSNSMMKVAPGAAGAAEGSDTARPTEQDPLTARREVNLAAQLRCLVCQNQSIAESNAELAQDLRRQIREQISQGRTDTQIIDFMTARYGDFVLYNPPMKGSTLLLWLGPLFMLLGGGYAASRIVRSRSSLVTGPLNAQDKARAEALLAEVPVKGSTSTVATNAAKAPR